MTTTLIATIRTPGTCSYGTPVADLADAKAKAEAHYGAPRDKFTWTWDDLGPDASGQERHALDVRTARGRKVWGASIVLTEVPS